MIPEDERTRRGEPVIVKDGEIEREGTIEWGGVTQRVSVYCEAGGRVQAALKDVRPDPGGQRPVWQKLRRIVDGR